MIAHRVGCPIGDISSNMPDWFQPKQVEDGRCTTCGATEPEPSARGFTERQIRQAADEERQRMGRRPTMIEVAAALHTSEPTLKRAMRDLGMGHWPPVPPED